MAETSIAQTETRFTRGPWRVSPHDRSQITHGHDVMVASVYDGGSFDAEYDAETEWANANLIAAAPEMYAALEALADAYYRTWRTDTPYVQAIDVLAKARGEVVS